uniref:Uncharacterized protein n=1 Tax=Daphnia galeata TaxID=27404 RepID=A0A8J2RJI9_9CRUS|nr:unnamed protein product [Daphnia galeata]
MIALISPHFLCHHKASAFDLYWKKLELRFGNSSTKSDVEVEKFCQRIYDKIKTSKKKRCMEDWLSQLQEKISRKKKLNETGLELRSQIEKYEEKLLKLSKQQIGEQVKDLPKMGQSVGQI